MANNMFLVNACAFTLTIILFAAAVTSAYSTTTIITTEEVVNRPGECSRQGQRLRSCKQYLVDSSRFATAGGRWREAFPSCCDELERIDQNCRCEAIKQIVDEQRQEGRLQGREMEEMLQTAKSLPALCRISPRQSCQEIAAAATFMY